MEARRLFEHIEIDWERLTLPAPSRVAARSESLAAPRSLGTIKPEDLRSVRSLLSLYRRAVALGLLKESEGSRIDFLATVAFCLRVGERPAALLAHLLRRGELPATLKDEDRACLALKRYRAKKRLCRPWLKLKEPEIPDKE